MTSLKLASLCSASLLAGMLASSASAQSVPTGNPGTPVQPGQRTSPKTAAGTQDEPTAGVQDQSATADQGQEIIVTGVRASIEKGLAVKREATQVVESIVAEDVGKLPDNNVVDALQRVTGVQVTNRSGGESNAVFIRGLPDVLTTLNGRRIFTASGQQFALADIPATLIGRVDVYKTRAADQIETGLAGQIDVFTRRPFDFKGFALSAFARGIYNEQADKFNPYLSGLISDRWETGIGDVGVLLNVSYSRNQYRDQSTTAGAMVPFVDPRATPPRGYVPLQRLFPPVFQPGLDAGLPTAPGSTLLVNGVQTPYLLSRDAVFSSDLRGDRRRPALNAAIQWAPNADSQYTAEFFWDGFRNTTFNSLLFSFVDWWGNLGPNPASTITLYDNTNIVKTRVVGRPFNFVSGDLAKSRTDSFVYALNGKWNVGDRLKLAADLAYQTSTFKSSFIALRTTRVANQITVDFNAKDGLPAFSFDDNALLTDPAQWTVGEFYDNGNRNHGSAITFQGDGDYEFDSDIFKRLSFGVRYDDRKADEANRTQSTGPLGQPFTSLGENYYYTNEGFFQGRADIPSSWVAVNGYYLASHADDIRQRVLDTIRPAPNIRLSSALQLIPTFNVDEITKSAYLQGDFEIDAGGRPLRIEAGVRYVDVRSRLNFYNRLTDTSSSSRQHTHQLLPSVTVRYDLSDNFRLRFNYGKTLRPPNFVDLNPNFNLTADLTQVGYGSGSGGNPNLRPTKATNYDVTAEWYFAPGSGIYGTVFRREINGLVVPLVNFLTINNSGLNTSRFIVTQPTNASNGLLRGGELGLVLFPRNLPGLLNGLGFQGSLTILRSAQNIPLTGPTGDVVGQARTSFFGVSNFSYNLTGAYDRGPVGLRLSYVWRKPFLNNNEARLFANPIGVWRRAEKSLDFQFTYQATRDFAVTFDATNLTNELSQSYYKFGEAGGPVTDNLGNAILARTFALGVRYSLK